MSPVSPAYALPLSGHRCSAPAANPMLARVRPTVRMIGNCGVRRLASRRGNFDAARHKEHPLGRRGPRSRSPRKLGWRTPTDRGGPEIACERGPFIQLASVLRTYLTVNATALVDYSRGHRDGLRIATSGAESVVGNLVNARMNKRRQMRWSPQGAHRVLQVRAHPQLCSTPPLA